MLAGLQPNPSSNAAALCRHTGRRAHVYCIMPASRGAHKVSISIPWSVVRFFVGATVRGGTASAGAARAPGADCVVTTVLKIILIISFTVLGLLAAKASVSTY